MRSMPNLGSEIEASQKRAVIMIRFSVAGGVRRIILYYK